MRFSISFHVTRQVCIYYKKKSKQPDEVLSIYLFHFGIFWRKKKQFCISEMNNKANLEFQICQIR